MTADAPEPSDKDLKYLRWALAGAEIFSTCSKAQYLSIIVDRFGTVAATGYNGSPPGWDHCIDGGCPRAQTQTTQGGSYSNCVAVHAEANALIRVSPRDCEHGTIYVGGLPCWDCAKLIIGSGLGRVVYLDGRRPVDESQVLDLFARSGAELIGVSPSQLSQVETGVAVTRAAWSRSDAGKVLGQPEVSEELADPDG